MEVVKFKTEWYGIRRYNKKTEAYEFYNFDMNYFSDKAEACEHENKEYVEFKKKELLEDYELSTDYGEPI